MGIARNGRGRTAGAANGRQTGEHFACAAASYFVQTRADIVGATWRTRAAGVALAYCCAGSRFADGKMVSVASANSGGQTGCSDAAVWAALDVAAWNVAACAGRVIAFSPLPAGHLAGLLTVQRLLPATTDLTLPLHLLRYRTLCLCARSSPAPLPGWYTVLVLLSCRALTTGSASPYRATAP